MVEHGRFSKELLSGISAGKLALNPRPRSLPVARVQEALEEVLLSFQFLELSFWEPSWQKQKWIKYGRQLKGAVRRNYILIWRTCFLWPRQTTATT